MNLLYNFDGNKNVSEVFYLAEANGIGAHYDYAPFGAVCRTTRVTRVTRFDAIEQNPFRFSSEFHDPELDLVYYNYRHYSPPLGRFLSRAPIEEQGGLNLYAFVKNQTAFETDILGRKGNWKSSGEVYNIECKITEAKPHVMHGSTGADGLLDKIYVTWEITGEVMCTCGDDEKFVKVKKSAIMGNEPITPIYVYKPMDNTPGTAISLWVLASTLLANLIESQLDSFFAFYFVNSKNDRSVIKRLIIKSINNKPDFKHELLGDDPCESLN